MHKLSLKFQNQHLETKYADFKWKFNQTPSVYLLLFNLYLEVFVSVYAAIYEMYQVAFYNILLFGCITTLFYISKRAEPHKILQTVYIIAAIIAPYQVEIYFATIEMKARKAGYYEWLLFGAVSQILYSFFSKFRIAWFFAIFSKIFGVIYVLYEDYLEQNSLNKNVIMLIILIFLGAGGDYNQDRNDRMSFMNQFISSKKNEVYKNLIELIPDQVLIWNDKKLIFANKSSFELFNEKELIKLEQLIMESLEIIDYNNLLEIEGRTSKDEKKSLFSSKISETLKGENEMDNSFNLKLYTANLKIIHNNEPSDTEYDLKMKKIFWENDDAVLILLSRVDEKNLNSRLEYVNAFLNYVLGNVSHDISTPFNILLGLLDTSIKQIKQKELLKDIKIARNMGEILINLFRTMIDLFNIRKGSLLLNLEIVNIHQELKEILNLFEEILKNRKVEVSINDNMPTIWTDRCRFRQIIIGILNYFLKNIEKTSIVIHLSKFSENLYEIFIETVFSKNRCDSNVNGPSSLKDIMMNKLKSSYNIQRKVMCSGVSDSFADGLLIDSGMNFSMLDYIVLCLSYGEMDHLEMDHKNHPNYTCSFRIKDINRSSILRLKDLLVEQKHFNVNYLKNGDFLGGEESQSYEGSSSFDDNKILISTFENTHITEFQSYTQNYKMMPTLEPIVNENNPVNDDSFIPFFKTSKHLVPSNFSSQSCRTKSKELLNFKKKYIILNVDDNFLNLMVISKYCRDFAFEVIEAKNGLEAIKEAENLLQKQKVAFDFIFMDCDMPILDGFEASKRINEIYAENKMFQPAIVAITANVTNEETRLKCKKNGMKEIVLKPLSLEKFKELLHKYLNI